MKSTSNKWLLLVVSSALAAGSSAYAQKNDACSAPQPATICNAGNTCGSASAPCEVDIKRTANAASITPMFAGAESDKPFCAAVGTTVTFKSVSKNTGFVVDFSAGSPFDKSDAIIGGSDRAVSVVAKTPGCYRYSTGACVSGAIYGMCGQVSSQLIVIAGGK